MNLVGYSPWGRKELDTTERLHNEYLIEPHAPVFKAVLTELHDTHSSRGTHYTAPCPLFLRPIGAALL